MFMLLLLVLSELVYMDIWGPSPIISANDDRYCLLIVDDHTRFTWVFFLKTRNQSISVFLKFKAIIELQYNCKLKCSE